MSAEFTKQFIDEEKLEMVQSLVLYGKNVSKPPQLFVLIAEDEFLDPRRGESECHNGDKGKLHPKHSAKLAWRCSEWTWYIIMSAGKANRYWNGKEFHRASSAFGFVQVNWDKAASSMKCGACVTHALYDVLLSSTLNHRYKLIWNRYTLLGFKFVEYDNCSSLAKIFQYLEFSQTKGMVLKSSDLVAEGDSISSRTGSRDLDEKIK